MKNISSLHVPHNKHTDKCEPIRIATPKEVVLAMNPLNGHSAQNMSTPIVKVGDYVRVGQVIAKEQGRFSTVVHATVSGTVVEIAPLTYGDDMAIDAIRIESDGKMEKDPDLKPPVMNSCEDFLQAVRASGVVGLGGASFPTWQKFKEFTNPGYTVDTVLINAAECEPYITSDHKMMTLHPDLIADGIEYLRKYMNEYLGNAVFKICIEKNKPDAIEILKETFKDKDYVVIHELEAIYPQGAKQIMLYNATGRVAVAGKRFPSFGATIINVSSLAKMAEYLNTGMPLVERIITLDGPAVKNPKIVIAPVGTRISHLMNELEFNGEVGKVVIGGPMNGHAAYSTESPIVKVANAVLFFGEEDCKTVDYSACIHCGRCVEHCPVGIDVVSVEKALRIKDENKREIKLIDTGVRQCYECACCTYVCPARRPLMAWNQDARWWLKQYAASKATKEGGN